MSSSSGGIGGSGGSRTSYTQRAQETSSTKPSGNQSSAQKPVQKGPSDQYVPEKKTNAAVITERIPAQVTPLNTAPAMNVGQLLAGAARGLVASLPLAGQGSATVANNPLYSPAGASANPLVSGTGAQPLVATDGSAATAETDATTEAAATTETDATTEAAEAGAVAVQQAYDQGGAEAASAELERQVDAAGSDQAAVDALITTAGPTIDLIARDMASGTMGPDQVETAYRALSNVADKASDAGLQVLAGKLAAAAPTQPGDGLSFFAAGFGRAGNTGDGARLGLAVAGQLQASGNTVAAQEIERAAMGALHQLQTNYTDLRTQREGLDAQLQSELAELEGSLTPEQKAAYIAEFQARHEDVYTAEAATARELEGAIRPNVSTLNAMAAADTTGIRATEVTTAMATLASSPVPAVAVEWASQVFQDGSPLAQTYQFHRGEIERDVVQRGLPGTMAQYQAEAGGDPDAALQKMEELYGQFQLSQQLFESPQTFQEAMQTGRQFLDAMGAARNGDPSQLRALLTAPGQLEGLSPFGSGIAAAGLAYGMLTIANADDLGEFVKGVANASQAGLELVAGTIGSLSESGRLARIVGQEGAESAARFATFASQRLIPAIGLGLNALSTVESFQALMREGGAGNLVSLIGNATSTLGSAISLFPPAMPVGKLLELAGAVVSFIGGLLTAHERAEAFNQEQQEILAKIFADPALSPEWLVNDPEAQARVASRLARSAVNLPELAQTAGLTPDQMFQIANRVASLDNQNLGELLEVMHAAGLQGQGFVDQLLQFENEDYGAILTLTGNMTLFDGLRHYEPGSPERLEYARFIAENLGIQGPNVPN
jgi:hypothetical protein